MKILQAAGWYFPDSLGGTEIYVAALASRLKAAGHQVWIAAPKAGLAAPERYQHDGVEVFRYPVPADPTRAEARGERIARGAEALHAWLPELRPDVVHLHTFVTGLGVPEARAARAVAARVIVTTHSSALGFLCERGTLMQWGTRPCDGLCFPGKCAACALQARGLARPLALAFGALPPSLGALALGLPGRAATALGMSALIRENLRRQSELLRTIDRFVVLTQWAFDAVVANGFPREKLALNRLGVSQPHRPPKPAPSESPTPRPLRLGYLGRLDPIKGVHDLVRAVASLPADREVVLELRAPLRTSSDQHVKGELAAVAQGDPRIRFAPEIAPAAVPELLAGYDVLCCPSRCHEGGPTVALEAHAAGTPVIGTRIGGLAELVRHDVDGALVEPGDWQALAALIARIAADPAGTVERWRTALRAPRSMDDVTRDYLELYRADPPAARSA